MRRGGICITSTSIFRLVEPQVFCMYPEEQKKTYVNTVGTDDRIVLTNVDLARDNVFHFVSV